MKPGRNRILIGAGVLMVLCWLAWYFFFSKPSLATTAFIKTAPAHQVGATPKVPGPVIAVPIKIIPKAVVRKKLPQLPLADDQEVIDTAEIRPAPYGATAVTAIDPAGLASTYVKANERPFFEFKKELELGGGADINTRGEKISVIEARFVPLRIGPAHLAIKGEGAFNPDAPRNNYDVKIGVRLFGRFD